MHDVGKVDNVIERVTFVSEIEPCRHHRTFLEQCNCHIFRNRSMKLKISSPLPHLRFPCKILQGVPDRSAISTRDVFYLFEEPFHNTVVLQEPDVLECVVQNLVYMFCRPQLFYISSSDSYFHPHSPPSTHSM